MASSLPPNPKKMFWNKDLVTEISLYLSIPSLFRCRAVCKMWRDVIDSPFFRKQHTLTRTRSSKEEDEDEKVYLQLNYDDFVDNDAKLSIKVVEKGKLFDLNLGFDKVFPFQNSFSPYDFAMFIRPVKGLICFNFASSEFAQPIVICNPFLGQFKILPFPPIPANSGASCEIRCRHVGIGCDGGEFYKVVELLSCSTHRCVHAHLYSRRTGSWRDLGDLDPYQHSYVMSPVMLSCSDGHFAHWYTKDYVRSDLKLVTFDMKNEVFRTIEVTKSESFWLAPTILLTVAKDESSFIVAVPHVETSGGELVRIYESSIREEEGIRTLSWNHVVDLEKPVVQTMPAPLPLWRRDCVMTTGSNVFFYDYGARRFIGCFRQPPYSRLFVFEGTFISP